MPIRVYNTMSKQKEDFEPLSSGAVNMYVCGPTVYDSAHMGHARSAVVFDVVFRYLKKRGFDTTYVRNFTDIDDKIINRARDLDTETRAIAEKYIAEFHEDMDALFVERPTHEPKATEYVAEIIGVVERLVEKGHAYEAGGDVYFSVDSFPGYGKLSGRKLEDMEAGARVEVDARKKNPFDFVLWKAAKPGEPQWDSPWGPGRPGWHIECSAMSSKLLGNTFDIHGGGKDLVFPHHENEVAQSEAAFGQTFVRYWMHNGFVNIDSEKMSKSLGNFKTVREILTQYHPEAVRLFLLSKHYRSPVDFTPDAMADAASGLDRLYGAMQRMENFLADKTGQEAASTDHWDRFVEVMDDDFNTAGAMGILFEMVREANRTLDEGSADPGTIAAHLANLKNMGEVLGLFNESADAYFEKQKERAAEKAEVDTAEIESLIAQRAEARKNKDFAAADAIRDRLKDMGVAIKDGPEGTTWKFE